MTAITKETYENNGIKVITDKIGEFWLNGRYIQKQLRLKDLPALTSKYEEEYKKCRYELNESEKQSHRTFIHVDLALKVILDCRTVESCAFKKNLGFTLHDVINTKEQSVISTIKDEFEGEDMQTQYSVLGYKIDLYFHKYKFAIEVDELGHADRNINNETERQRALERELNCVFIRINPDERDFSMLREINKIYRHINRVTKEQTEEKTKESVIDNLSNELLKLEFKKNDSIKSKYVRWIVKNILPGYKNKNIHDHLLMLAKIKFNSIKTLIFQALIDLFFIIYIVQQ